MVVENVPGLNDGRALSLQLVTDVQMILVGVVVQITIGLAFEEGDEGLKILLPRARVTSGLLESSGGLHLFIEPLRALGLGGFHRN